MVTKKKKRDYSSIMSQSKKEVNYSNKKKDERFWQPTRDKEGNGFAIIRFLPNGNPTGLPFKPVFKHVANIAGKFFIEKCPSTLKKECPICEWNRLQPREWVLEEGKTYRKKSYISNILVVSDPECPDNDGKIFLFEFGDQVFKKLKEKISPSFAAEDPMIYFHPEEGANFKVKIKKEGGYATWNSSEFDGKITDVDDFLKTKNTNFDEIEASLYDLDTIVSETDYKSFDEIKGKFKKYLFSVGLNGNIDESPEVETKERKENAENYSKKKAESQKVTEESLPEESESEGEDSSDANFEEYFKNLEK